MSMYEVGTVFVVLAMNASFSNIKKTRETILATVNWRLERLSEKDSAGANLLHE